MFYRSVSRKFAHDGAGSGMISCPGGQCERPRPGAFANALPKINLLEPAFVMSVGDIVEGNTSDRSLVERRWNEIEAAIARLTAPSCIGADCGMDGAIRRIS